MPGILRCKSFCLYGFLLILFSSCVSTPVPENEAVTPPQINRTQGFVAEAFKLIASGSPAELRDAYSLLDSRQELSDYAEDLRYLSSWLFNTLYPALTDPVPAVEAVPGSYFSSLTKDIAAGVYPVTRISEGSYLFFLLPPMSVLFTERLDTLDIAYESLFAGHSLNPGGTLPQFLLGYVEERRGNFDDAITWYISAIQTAVDCYPAGTGMVRIYIKERRYSEAALVLDELEAVMQPTGDLLYLRGRTELALQHYSDALEALSASRDLEGESQRILLALAQTRYRRGELTDALGLLDKIQTRGLETGESLLLEGRIYREAGQRIRALTLLSRGQTRYPENQGIKDLYAQVLLETGRTSEGRELLEKISVNDEENANTDIMLMESAAESELWHEADVYLQQVLEKDRSPAVLRRGVEIYLKVNEPEKALELLSELGTLAPDNPEYPLRSVEIAIKLGVPSRVLPDFDRLENMQLSKVQLSRYKTTAASLTDSNARRRQLLEEAIFLNVRNVNALLDLAFFWLSSGEKQRGSIYLQQVERMSGIEQEQQDRILKIKTEFGL